MGDSSVSPQTLEQCRAIPPLPPVLLNCFCRTNQKTGLCCSYCLAGLVSREVTSLQMPTSSFFSLGVFFISIPVDSFPLLRVRHWFRKAGLCFRSPGCRFGACCKISLAHGGRKTQKHTMQSEKLKIMFDCSNGKLLKLEQLPPLQRKAGLK